MPIVDVILMELDQEAATTRRVLERVPGDKLGWKPHVKSMTLGELAMHVATTPAVIAQFASVANFEMPDHFERPVAASTADVVSAHDKSIAEAKARLRDINDAAMMATWTLSKGGKTIFSIPRAALIRSLLLNHWYHHRGQL